MLTAFCLTKRIGKLELIDKRKEELFDLLNKRRRGTFVYTSKYSVDGEKITVSNIKFVESRRGDIRVYKDVEEGHPYVINLDPAMGGEDFYAIQVFDNYTGEQVAVFHKNKADDDEVAFQLMCLGWHYNNALICAECNNPNGSYILKMCEKAGYRNIYQDSDYEEITDRYANKFGYKTKTNNRNVMIALFRQAFRDNYKMINDYETLLEMEAFQIVKNGTTGKEKAEANGNSHDDLVMALCGIFLIRDNQSFLPNIKTETKHKEWNPLDCIEIQKPKRKGVFIEWD